MRFLVCVGRFPVSSETFVYNQVVDLLDRGVAVDVLALTCAREKDVGHGTVERLQQDVGVYIAKSERSRLCQVYSTIWKIARITVSSPRQATRLALGNAEADGLRERANAIHIGFALKRLEGSYDAVICHFGQIGSLLARVKAAGLYAMPLVCFFHGEDVTRHIEACGRDIYQTLFREAHALVANSVFTRSRLAQAGAPLERVHVISPGVDLALFSYCSRHDRPAAGVRFLNVGRCFEGKGQLYLLQAFALLRDEMTDWTLDIVGDGPLLGALKEEARRLQIEGRVHFHGAVGQDRVFALMRESDVFVMPSVVASDGWQEAFGLALVEAQATGLPVIGTTVGGMPEALIEGRTGLLVPPRDPVALSEAMRDLGLSPTRRRGLGEQGRAFVEAAFQQRSLNSKLLALVGAIEGPAVSCGPSERNPETLVAPRPRS